MENQAIKVSVIIPVYNAEKYIRQAVQSALDQPETGEVILIEDGSSDNSLDVCKELVAEYQAIKLLRHKDGKNHGPGASRNLGIISSLYEYICFLDADDFFLPNRFAEPKNIFKYHPEIEGVYEAVAYFFQNESGQSQILECHGKINLITMAKHVPPELFFESQSPIGSYGHCSIIGWVIKRSVFEKTGLFDIKLRLHQDTVLQVKISALCRLMAGRLDTPVAMYRIHGSNRFHAVRSDHHVFINRILMWKTLLKWGKVNLDAHKQNLIIKSSINYVNISEIRRASYGLRIIIRIWRLVCFMVSYPEIIFKSYFWKVIIINSNLLKRKFLMT